MRTGRRLFVHLLLVSTVFVHAIVIAAEKTCGNHRSALQILGSGGPELSERAGPAYLLWHDGRARLLIDAGPGTRIRLAESAGRFEDLDAVLLTHLHVDHANDLPALIKAGYFTSRNRPLDVLGPSGNASMPSTRRWLANLLGDNVYRYLSGHVKEENDGDFAVRGVNIDAGNPLVREVWRHEGVVVKAAAVGHGPIPAVAYRIEGPGFALAISGDTHGMSSSQHALEALASGTTLFVANHAIPEQALGTARQLHMAPSQIGQIAAASQTMTLVLSHRMKRTLGSEDESTALIRRHFNGHLEFAEDLMCLPLLVSPASKK